MRVRGFWCAGGGGGSCLLSVRPGRLGRWSGRPRVVSGVDGGLLRVFLLAW